MRFVIAACAFVLCLTLVTFDKTFLIDDISAGVGAASRSGAVGLSLRLAAAGTELTQVADAGFPASGTVEPDEAGNAGTFSNSADAKIASLSPDNDEIAGPLETATRPKGSMDEICQALAEAAEANDIPISFFARLIWQESRFQSREISSAGAQGVAQFMPETAVEFGLDDPFDPLKALPASARFLRRLHDQFGNLGLAAAAYNAGSGRVQNWLARRQALPMETRDYVRKITGTIAEKWLSDSETIAVNMNLPRNAPCEGVAGLSHTKELTPVTVTLTPAIKDVVAKARLDAERAAAAHARRRAVKFARANSVPARSARADRHGAVRAASGEPRRLRTRSAALATGGKKSAHMQLAEENVQLAEARIR